MVKLLQINDLLRGKLDLNEHAVEVHDDLEVKLLEVVEVLAGVAVLCLTHFEALLDATGEQEIDELELF